MTDLELGGNITLVGFKDISKAELVVVKKIVGSYARKIYDTVPEFQRLKVSLKPVHKIDDREKYELNSSVLIGGQHFEAELVERNLFVGLDAVLQKVSEHAFREAEKQEEKY